MTSVDPRLIDSPNATVRLRTDKTKGWGSRVATLTMVFKLAASAEKRFRRLNSHALIGDVVAGIDFKDGENKPPCQTLIHGN